MASPLKQGELDAANNKLLADNPYAEFSSNAAEWEQGWLNFKRLRERVTGEAFDEPFDVASRSLEVDSAFTETFVCLNGEPVTRIRTRWFLIGAGVSPILGLWFFGIDRPVLGFSLMFTVAPTLALYPAFRMLFGGKGGMVPIAISYLTQEYLQRLVMKWFDRK